MIQRVRTVAKRLAMRYRGGLLTRIATLIAIVVYPLFEFGAGLHHPAAKYFVVKRFMSVASGVQFDPVGGHILSEGLHVGSNSVLRAGARIWALKDIRIAIDVMCGPEFYVMDGYHPDRFHRKDDSRYWRGRMTASGCRRRPVSWHMDDHHEGRARRAGIRYRGPAACHQEPPAVRHCRRHPVPCHRKRFGDADLSEHLRLLGHSPARMTELLHELAGAIGEPC